MLFIKNKFNPAAVKQNKNAFAELPGHGMVSAPKVKASDTANFLADSAQVRDGKYVPNKPGYLAAKASAKANAGGFAELPGQTTVKPPKPQQISVEDVLADSASVRDGLYKGPSLAAKIGSLMGNLARGVGSLLSSSVKGLGNLLSAAAGLLVAGVKTLGSVLAYPFTKLADNKANKAAFAQLPGEGVVTASKVKTESAEDILASSLQVRTGSTPSQAAKTGKPSKSAVKAEAKANAKAMNEMPSPDLATPPAPKKSVELKQAVANNVAAFRRAQAAQEKKFEEKSGAVEVKTYVLPVVPSQESLVDAVGSFNEVAVH